MGGTKIVTAALLSAAVLFAGTAQAMEIRQFDKMAGRDQDEYIAEVIQAAETTLTGEGKPDQSAQVKTLFATNLGNDQISLGMTEIYRNIALARVADAKRAASDPSARRIQVEDAFAVTMKKNSIILPGAFFTVLSNFKPKFPPQTP